MIISFISLLILCWLIKKYTDNHKNSSNSVFDDEDDFYSYVNEDFKN